jgi:hypothetical protein
LKGFHDAAWQYLRGEVAAELGRRSLANKPFPLSTRVLMSPDILNAAAFTSHKDKESVPAWRDGRAGEALQLVMAKCVEERMFKHGVISIRSDAFKDGASWVAFARLEPVITNVLKQEFGDDSNVWPDAVGIFFRELWRGDLDQDILKTSLQLPPHYDSRYGEMLRAVKEQFVPLACVLRNLKAAAAMQVVAPEESRDPSQDAPGFTDNTVSTGKDGDVTKDLADGMSPSDKQKLVKDLNAQAVRERDTQLQSTLCEQAAALLRNRLVMVRRAHDAKTLMQTSSQG